MIFFPLKEYNIPAIKKLKVASKRWKILHDFIDISKRNAQKSCFVFCFYYTPAYYNVKQKCASAPPEKDTGHWLEDAQALSFRALHLPQSAQQIDYRVNKSHS